jgi:hypothetical protein
MKSPDTINHSNSVSLFFYIRPNRINSSQKECLFYKSRILTTSNFLFKFKIEFL